MQFNHTGHTERCQVATQSLDEFDEIQPAIGNILGGSVAQQLHTNYYDQSITRDARSPTPVLSEPQPENNRVRNEGM